MARSDYESLSREAFLTVIERLEARIARQDDHIRRLEAHIARQDAHILRLEARIKQLEDLLDQATRGGKPSPCATGARRGPSAIMDWPSPAGDWRTNWMT